jgi:hypothetical protein
LDLDFARDSLPIALQQSALVSFELRARRAHQITGSSSPQALEIFFAHNATIKDPHPSSTTVFALHGIEHLLKGGHFSPVAREDFVGERKTFRGDNQRDNDLLAVWPVIARVATLGFVDFLGLPFKVGARQIVKEHIESGAKEILPSL